jgi:ATP-dependent protease HslVU (ClpYQ) peptidase subunit
MTIIAAAYDSPTDYAIAADSYSVVNSLRLPSPAKVVRTGDMLIGGAGSGNETATGLAWIAAHVDHANQHPRIALADMRRHILDTTERVGELKGLDSHYLMVGPGGILVLGSDGHISDMPSRWAIGCGEDVGLGAMFRRPGSPAEVVRVAVEAACALREGCFGEAVVLACGTVTDHDGRLTHWGTP